MEDLFKALGPVNPWLALIITAGASALCAYFGAFFSTKAKYDVLTERIGEVTKIQESIKSDLAKDLESIKADLGSRLFMHRTRYQMELGILRQISKACAEVKKWSAEFDAEGKRGASRNEERYKAALDNYVKAYDNLSKLMEENKPFFPNSIYGLVSEVERVSNRHKYSMDGSILILSGLGGSKTAELIEILNSVMKINALVTEVQEAIRERVKEWEPLFMRENNESESV